MTAVDRTHRPGCEGVPCRCYTAEAPAKDRHVESTTSLGCGECSLVAVACTYTVSVSCAGAWEPVGRLQLVPRHSNAGRREARTAA